MSFRQRILHSVRSNAGETITEVLVGVLIVGLATVVLATMINVATQISLSSTDALQGAYGQMSGLDTAASSSAPAAVTVTSDKTSWGGSLSWSPQVQLLTSDETDANGYSFQRYEFTAPTGGGS